MVNAKIYYSNGLEEADDYILLLIMRLSICGFLSLLLLAAVVTSAESETTKLTYFVEYE